MDSFDRFRSKKDISSTRAGPNVNAAAWHGSHITIPALINSKITGNVHIIHNAPGVTGYRPHSTKPQTSAVRSLIFKHKTRICSEYQYVTEYNSLPGERVLLSERYTQPLILQRHRDQHEREEELRSSGEDFQQVLSSRSGDESCHLNSLFNPDGHGISPSAVILQGNSGNGKSFTVQKIMLDWASDKLWKERFDIVFHLKCKEINRISGKKSLVEILSYSCSLTPDEISQMLQQSPEKMLFIIDGFDELRLTQDYNYMSPHTDLLQKASPEVTLCALLRGRIMPESFLLVTTRSTATDTLDKLLKGPQRFTEIMGFSEKGVEEYFQKFFQDEELFRKAFECVKANETLITACSIPVICWIICTVMRERFGDCADVKSGLETTTSIYVDFVSTLLEHHCQGLNQSVPTLLRSLGQLAERGMLEQQVLFDEKSVNEMVSETAGNPFLRKFLFNRRIRQETMFSFMHLSFQEFFTALYYVLLDEDQFQKKLSQHNVCNSDDFAIPRYAVVLQFIFGLLNEDVRHTLRRKHLFVHPNIQEYLKKWVLEDIKVAHCDRALFILQCLYELHEDSFVREVMECWDTIEVYNRLLRRTDCWALLYCCQCCQSMKTLQLGWCQTYEKLYMILPVLPKFESIILHRSDLTDFILAELMCVVTRRQTLSSVSVLVDCCNVISYSEITLKLLISEEMSRFEINLVGHEELRSFSLTFPDSIALISTDWRNFFQILYQWDADILMSALHSLSGLQKMELNLSVMTESWAIRTLSFNQNCTCLQELSVNACLLREEGIKTLQKSISRPGCTLTFKGYICNKLFDKCTTWSWNRKECEEHVSFHLNSRGFFMETLRKPLFLD